MSKEIITVCVGQMHYGGTLKEGEVVELKLLEESDFENNIGVFNQDGIQCGSIINKRYDADIVEGIYNNNMIIDFMNDYDWIAVKVYKHKSFLQAVPKAVKNVSDHTIETLEAHVETLKDSLHVIITALDDILVDIRSLQQFKTEIDSAVRCYSDLSKEVIVTQTELPVSKGTSKVFDYYSKEAAK